MDNTVITSVFVMYKTERWDETKEDIVKTIHQVGRRGLDIKK